MEMDWSKMAYAITGIPVVDGVFTIVVKIMFMILLFMMLKRCIGHYSRGEEGKMFIAWGVGILLLAAVLGFENIANAAKSAADIFDFSGGGKTGAGK